MLMKRVVVCLDVKDGRVVKGVNFRGLRDVGDPVELAERYEAEGADEIVFLDISASAESRSTLLETVSRTAERLFIPLTVGGGIGGVEDVAAALRAGADKVSINSAAVRRPELLAEAAGRFGRQCVVASIDAALEADVAAPATTRGPRFRVFTHGGTRPTELDAIEWAARCAELGAGEILITSIDRDGRRDGYDLELTGTIARTAAVPVIASGGAGRPEHVRDVFVHTPAEAALLAGILHDGECSVADVKRALARAGLPVREPAAVPS